jgi:hypothetical protein
VWGLTSIGAEERPVAPRPAALANPGSFASMTEVELSGLYLQVNSRIDRE